MKPEEVDKIVVDTLIKESIELRKFVQDGFASGERFFTIAVAVLVGGFTIGLVNDHPGIFVILPFPLLILWASAIQLYTEALNRAGYRCYLEEAVNQELGRAVLIEEFLVARSRQGRLSLPLMQALVLLAVCLSVLKSILTSLSDFPWEVAFGNILAISAGLVMVYAAFNEMNVAFKRGYDAAKESKNYDKDRTAPSHPMLNVQGPFYDFRIVRRMKRERKESHSRH